MTAALLSGIIFGLSGGVSPGPLFVLVISQTINHGLREGIKISIAPLITDAPIVLAAWFLIIEVSGLNLVMGLISTGGAIYLAKLGWDSLRVKVPELASDTALAGSFKKGITANLLNPSPYLFWCTIGVPTLLDSWKNHPAAAVFFLITFYFFLIGSKIFLACVTSKSGRFISSSGYVLLNKILGLILWAFSIIFLIKSFAYLLA